MTILIYLIEPVIFRYIPEFADILDNIWSSFKKFDESLLRRRDVELRISAMKFDGRKYMFVTNLEEGMRDEGKFLEEICVFFFCYDIND